MAAEKTFIRKMEELGIEGNVEVKNLEELYGFIKKANHCAY